MKKLLLDTHVFLWLRSNPLEDILQRQITLGIKKT
jgi:PIN domain nuclease of toxin-antitoxin system